MADRVAGGGVTPLNPPCLDRGQGFHPFGDIGNTIYVLSEALKTSPPAGRTLMETPEDARLSRNDNGRED